MTAGVSEVQLTSVIDSPSDTSHTNDTISDNSTNTPQEDEEIDQELLNKLGKDEFADDEQSKPKEKSPAEPTVGLFALFQFATPGQICLLILGIIGSLMQGVSLPLLSYFLGQLVDDMNTANFQDKVNTVCLVFTIIGIGSAVGGFLSISCFSYVAEQSAATIRMVYLKSILRQDISWYDRNNTGETASRLTAYTRKYQEGVGDKFALVIQALSCFISGLVVAFYKGWLLSLVILAPAPVMVIVSAIFASLVANSSSNELGKYAAANHVCLQTLENMRSVTSYRMENFMIDKFVHYARIAYYDGKKRAYGLAGGIGFFYLVIFGIYALGLWFGAWLMLNNKRTWGASSELYSGGTVLAVFYAIIQGVMQIGQASPHMASIASAQSALYSILEVVNRKSECDPFLDAESNVNAIQLGREAFVGALSFQNVTFAYPTRLEVNVLEKFTYTFQANAAIGLAGPSGCGKSSTMALIERWYDPSSGNIFAEVDLDKLKMDDHEYLQYAQKYPDLPINKTSYDLYTQFRHCDEVSVTNKPEFMQHPLPPRVGWVNLKDINIGLWRRECVGLVNQQPVLWSGTIAQNLRYANPNATHLDIERVAKQCGAHDFVSEKHFKYETDVGENGSNLSGGQRQRLSLARTLLAKPRLALFDEVTSMLDSHNERQIQRTLDELFASHTFGSISIAHRLSTLYKSDIIIVMKEGKIVETGTHQELSILEGGVYKGMIDIIRGNNHVHSTPAPDTGAVLIARESMIDPQDNHDYDTTDDIKIPHVDTIDDDGITYELVEYSGIDDPVSRSSKHPDLADADNLATLHATTDSTTSNNDEDENKVKSLPSGYIRRFIKDCVKLQAPLFFLAAVFGGIEGAVFPVYSLLMSKVLTMYYDTDKGRMYDDVRMYAVWFVLLGIGALFAVLIKGSALGVASERVLLWFRTRVFTNIVHLEIGFHDEDENSASIITTKLASDTNYVRSISAELYGQLLSAGITALVSFGISFYRSWHMTLVMFIVFPVLSCTAVFQWMIISGFGSKSKKYIEAAGLLVIEGIRNIRVVTSFNAEDQLYEKFADKQANIIRIGTRSAVFAGLGFGSTQFLLFGSYALSFYIGAIMVKKNLLSFEDELAVFLSIEMASFIFGGIISQIPTIDKSRAAFIDLYKLMDRQSLYDVRRTDIGQKFDITNCVIEFDSVSFHYPTAPTLPVLKGVSFKLDPTLSPVDENGDRPSYLLGICGNSGGGKSTIASQILPHFYRTIQPGGDEYNVPEYNETEIAANGDEHLSIRYMKNRHDPKAAPTKLIMKPRDKKAAGRITVDGNDVDDFQLDHLRKHVVLCAQDSPLFYGTVRENIQAGDTSITDEEMIEAAKTANIHNIIDKFPHKYDTLLTGNTSVSGGQRARIALARAFARRDLRIIILDESLSALDNYSASVIQKNLQVQMKNKIIISIAHRLESLRNAQKIVVLQDGVIAENGTHEELMKLHDGKYRNLLMLQQ